jgi:hypothetical protein
MTRVGRWLARPALVALTALAGLASGPAWSQAPGERSKLFKPFVVGPNTQPADNAKFGFVVAISYQLANGKGFLCTGTLLTSQIVLTAGHCGCGVPDSYGIDFNQDTRADDLDRIHNVEGAPILFDQRVCVDQRLGGGNDLALIRLAAKAPKSADLPAPPGFPGEMVIQQRATLTKGMPLTAVGYGFTSAGTLGVRNLAPIPIFSFDCEERALGRFCAPFAEMILAEALGPRARDDTCGGDSGGPVFRLVDGVPRIVGVTSRAAPGIQDDPTLHCGGGGIYTLLGRVTVHQWLLANGVPPAP